MMGEKCLCGDPAQPNGRCRTCNSIRVGFEVERKRCDPGGKRRIARTLKAGGVSDICGRCRGPVKRSNKQCKVYLACTEKACGWSQVYSVPKQKLKISA